MTDQTTPEGVLPSRDIVAIADRQFEASLLRLDAIITQLEADRAQSGNEVSVALAAVRKAVEGALSERARFDRIAGGGANTPGPALNLADARLEIGRRLAGLRAAGGSG